MPSATCSTDILQWRLRDTSRSDTASFTTRPDLKRFCQRVQFLAEPVVVLISTHGTPAGIRVFGETIPADVIAESLTGASNVKLLHLSGCGMMSGDFPVRSTRCWDARLCFRSQATKRPLHGRQRLRRLHVPVIAADPRTRSGGGGSPSDPGITLPGRHTPARPRHSGRLA